ncbi:MAG: hypothetical protein EPN34_01205 [Burkholderiaceae bacterium]|jgi:hypothetical protein|nr:MAG: hypothetical protein EPN34_01205 [Burkholderiaceae bacterium]
MVDPALNPIRSDAEYRATLGQISSVFESGKVLPSESPEWNRISVLLALVDAWEQSCAADDSAEESEAIGFATSNESAVRPSQAQPVGAPSVGARMRGAPEIRNLGTDVRMVA